MRGDEGAFRRWVGFELDALNRGTVTKRRALADLLKDPRPQAPARGGAHAFDPVEVQRLAAALPTELRFALRVPIQVCLDSEVSDACYVQDAAAAEALVLLGIALGRPDARGRRWFSRAMALRAVRDWPTCVQVVHL